MTMLLSLFMSAQDSTKPVFRGDVRAYIGGRQFEEMAEPTFFQKPGKLLASDSSYKIISFAMTWDDEEAIHTRSIAGNEFPNIEKDYLTSDLNRCCYVTFDHIKAKKKDSIFYIRSLAIKIMDASTVNTNRQNVVPCYAEVEGFSGREVFSAAELRNGFSIVLTDRTFRLVDFELEVEDPDTEELKFHKINGNKAGA